MKKLETLEIIIALLVIPLAVIAQGIQIPTGATVTCTGAATIELNNGYLINNGTYTKGTETVTFSGNTADSIAGSSNTDLYNLVISNTGGITTKLSQLNVNAASIASESQFTIPPKKAVTVSTAITNSAGVNGIIIQSSPTLANGTLIFHNDVNSPVPATVEMYTKASKPTGLSYKWQFFGIPIRSMTAYPTFNGSYVRQMHEDDSPFHWHQLNNLSTMNSFTGYEITQLTPTTLYFQGNLENSNYGPLQLNFTSTASYPGEHLIGNPYTAAIDIKKLVFGAQMLATTYLYNTGSYADWTAANLLTDSTGTAPGQYTSVPQNLAGSGSLPSQIPSMQAFLVKASKLDAAATISIPYSSTGTMMKNTDLQRARQSNDVFTRIDVTGSSFRDRMWLFTVPGCTHNFDNGWDGEKLFGTATAPQLFAWEDDGYYQVNSVEDINNTFLGFQAGVDTTYTLTFTNQNTTSNYTRLYLVDLTKNVTKDISLSGSTYTFNAFSTIEPVQRFKIVASNDFVTNDRTSLNNGIKIYCSNNILFIDNPTLYPGDLSLYNVTGRLIEIMHFTANVITTKKMNLTSGIYVVKGIAGNMKLTCQFKI